MAGKPNNMHQIKQVIELLTKGYSIRSIARMSGIARNTIILTFRGILAATWVKKSINLF